MFGPPGNTSFSGFNTATQTSPFGQSAFGKPITTTSFGSGAAPVFGSSNTSLFSSKPTGSTAGGLFGNTTTPPAFRQPTNTQPSFGGFGTTNSNTNLFGSQQNAGTNLFGTNPATSAFGQSAKPAGFSFGANSGTNLFGQPQQSAQQTTPFGQTTTTGNTNLFGTAPGFGSANTTATTMTGTVVKFTPVITTDSMSKNGISHSISARHCCIASMKEYESKSYEELRFEDYSVGRKGPSTGLFGSPAQPSPFGTAGAAGTSTATTGFGGMNTSFGATSQSGSNVLFGKPMTSFGTPATTTTNSFAFNSTPGTNLFGTNTQAKPFGTAAPTPLFATSNTNQTAGAGFGAINTAQNTGFGSGFGSTQPNQSIALFNQNKSAFNVPATSSATGFTGFGQTGPSNTTTNLFGAKPGGNTGFGTTPTFGATTASTFGSTTGFTAGQNAGTSLFNTSFKPTGQTSGFSFGSTPAPSTGLGTNTGLTLGGGSTLFGQQKPGGLFGNTGGNTTFNNPGSFGSTAFGTNSTVGSGIGMGLLPGGTTMNQTKNSGGSVPVHQQILALVSAPFGDSPLLKNLLPASGKTEELLKPTNAASRVLNSPQYKVTTNNKSPKVKTKVVTAAQLSKKSLFDGLEEEDPVLSEAFQPRSNAKRLVLRPKPITTLQSPNENSAQSLGKGNSVGAEKGEERVDVTKNSYGENSVIEVTDKENHIQDNNQQLTNDRRSSSSWLKSSLPRKSGKASNEESFEGQRSPFSAVNLSSEEALNNTVTELRPHVNSNAVTNQIQSEVVNNSTETALNSSAAEKNSTENALQNSDSSQDLNDSSFSTLQTSNWTANSANVILRRVGYYTIPPLDQLHNFVCGETCVVPHFTIGRKGYGNVYFSDSFDIYGLNLDEIVHFRHKEVIIYPDDEKKPPVGQGLNRKAQVTLDKVWPHDKSLHEPITDPHRLTAMDYEGKLRRVSAKHDTRFLEYRPETGSWVFKVDHFSKYGLSDSDEDDSANNVATANDQKRLKTGVDIKQQKIGKKLEPGDVRGNSILFTPDGGIINVSSYDELVQCRRANVDNGRMISTDNQKLHLMQARFSDDSEDEIDRGDYNNAREKHHPISPTADNARMIGTDSHKLQLMKASFFHDSDVEFERESNSVLPFSGHGASGRYFPDINEKFDENRDYESIYNPILRSNLTIHRLPRSMDLQDDTLVCKPNNVQTERLTTVFGTESSTFGKIFPDPVITPVTTVLKCQSEVIPFVESIIHRLRSRVIADMGIQMGRMFRPSWGRGLTLLTLSTQDQASKVPLHNAFEYLGSYVSGRLPGDKTSATIVQRLQVLGGNAVDEGGIQAFKESIVGHLRIQLSNCIMGQEGDCPVFDVATETATTSLHAHCTLARELVEQLGGAENAERSIAYVAEVWKLCVALWGDLPDIHLSTGNAKHHNVVVRREAVGEWLKTILQKRATPDEKNADVSNEEKTLLLLTAFELEEACKSALTVGDHCLALLMAQLRSGMPTKELVKQQIALWQETSVDKNLSIDRLKLFALMAGEPLISSKHGAINVCEGLDWKRAFAVHLWYFSSPTASIRDALELYEAAFESKPETDITPATAKGEEFAYAYAASPRPEYREYEEIDYDLEINNGKSIYDLCYHLLKLYCTGDHGLGELLNPSTHTADPLDYRLSWLMQQVLVALGYSHISENVAALTHVNFATQLEAYGLWHWAIFVMLHLRDTGRRKTAVMDLLQRHIEVDDVPDYVEREQFLREELGIPSTWIHRAKAVKCCVVKRYGEAAWYFIQAEEWNTAHEVIMDHLAADAIINENYEYLRTLLSPLITAECSDTINGWANQGQLLWDYMEITIEIENLLRIHDPHGITYKLELLKPRLTSLCIKINFFPCPSAKHRLCQAEIAKRTLHLARNLLVQQSRENKSTANTLVHLVSQLPLPEDYAQQELRLLANMRVNEIIANV